jgi:hypothetical protein
LYDLVERGPGIGDRGSGETDNRQPITDNRTFGALALPFEAPRAFACAAGLSVEAIVAHLYDHAGLDRAWAPMLDVFVDDLRIPREMWGAMRPKPGRFVLVRARPRAPLVPFIIDAAINIAIAVGVNLLVNAFVGKGPETPSSAQLAEIDSARNEIARWRKVPVVLGQFRTFPPHAAKAYTQGADEKVYLYMLLCWGLGPVSLKNLRIGDTAIENFAGVEVQHRLAPSDPSPTLFASQADEEDGPGEMSSAFGWVMRTATSDSADQLQVEIAFIQGLIVYPPDGGTRDEETILAIRYRAVGATDWLDFQTGAVAPEGHTYDLAGYQKRKPFRMTFTKDVARGQYEVGVKRVSPDETGTHSFNRWAWSKLRSFTFNAPVIDDNLAITALKIEAGDQLNGVVDLVNAEIYRIAPRWDADTSSFGAASETSNPAELVRWIVTGPGAARPRDPVTQIDDAAFGAWAELCHERGWRCDLELRAGAGQDEIMTQVAQCGRATLVQRRGKLTPVVDDLQVAPVQLFTPRNVFGFRAQRRYSLATHAIRLTFANVEKDYQPDEMIVYYPGYDVNSAEQLVTASIAGKVNAAEAREAGKRIIAEDLLRPEDYSWRCDWEHLAVAAGQRAQLAHYTIAVGRRAARVKALTLDGPETHVTALTLDETVTQTAGDDYGLECRLAGASGFTVTHLPLANMENGAGDVVTLATPALIADAPEVGDLVVFGDLGIETLDVVIRTVAPLPEHEAELTAVPYNPGIADGDFEGLTDFDDDTTYGDDTENLQDPDHWSSNVVLTAFPAPPAPEIVNVLASSNGIFADFTYPIASAERVKATEAYWRHLDDTSVFELVRVMPGDQRLAAFAAGTAGDSYVIKLISVDARGRKTEGVETVVTSQAVNLPFSGSLSQPSATVSTNSDGTGGDYSSAGGVFGLFIGGTQVTPIVDPLDSTQVAATFTVVSASAGLAINIDAEGVYTVLGLVTDTGTALLRMTRQGVDIDQVYSISKAKAGAPAPPPTPPSGFVATINCTTTVGGVSLRALADAAGYTGFSDATVTFVVPAGVTLTGAAGAPNGGYAIDTGLWPVDDYAIALTLVIESGGKVFGGGGKAGAGGSAGTGGPGGNGGDAIYCQAPLTINNQAGGELRAGGAGGGGGGRARFYFSGWHYQGGGGGGGGAPNGAGGAGGNVSGSDDGDAGTAGTTGGGGVGGLGGENGSFYGGAGGNGGGFAAAGVVGQRGNGTDEWDGGAGGVAGYAVRKNGKTVSVTGLGVTQGAVA